MMDRIIKAIDSEIAKKIFQELRGNILSNSWQDCGTIFLDFGELQKGKRNHPIGNYSFMVDSPWRFENKKEVICSSENSEKDIFLKAIIGATIKEINLIEGNKNLNIMFDELLFVQNSVDKNSHTWSLSVNNISNKYIDNVPDRFWLYYEFNSFSIEYYE
jgi:hypothetical protein